MIAGERRVHRDAGRQQVTSTTAVAIMPVLLFVVFIAVPPYTLSVTFSPNQAGGLHAQHHDQQGKGKRVGEGGIAQSLDDLLAQSDDECADNRAGEWSRYRRTPPPRGPSAPAYRRR